MTKLFRMPLVKKAADVKKDLVFQMNFKEVKVEENGRIRIKGYASTPEIDRYDDIVNPSAFTGAMENYMKNPVVLLQHNYDKVLGQVVDYAISPKGLEVTAELSNDIDNCFQNIVDKNLRGFSIGFICKEWGYREEGGRQIREIKDLDLIEISVVSTPANPSSLFTLSKSVKAFFSDIDKEEAKEVATEGEEEEKSKNMDENEEMDENGNPKKPKKECEDDEEEEKSSNKDDPKTEKEAPAGEAPATEVTLDVPATDNSEPVKAGENPTEQNPAPTAEVEDLKSQVAELTKQLEAEKAKSTEISKKLEETEGKLAESESKFVALEKEFLSIEVKPGTKIAKGSPSLVKKATKLTDSDIFRLMSRR